MDTPRILLVGYNGANNTGAEALLRADIDDVRAVLGRHVHITIPSLNPSNLRRYIREGPELEIVRIPTVFFRAMRRLVRDADVVVLVEGSAYMDTWTSALLWFFLWATLLRRRRGEAVSRLRGGCRHALGGEPGARPARGELDGPHRDQEPGGGEPPLELGRHGADAGHGRQRAHVHHRPRG